MADAWTVYGCGVHAGPGHNAGKSCPLCKKGGTISHLPAEAVTIGTQRRQVCAWCGTVLEDLPLLRTYTSDGGELPMYATDCWYRFDGPAKYMVSDFIEPPDDACCRIAASSETRASA